jgi:hypothetical protein
MKKFIPLFFFIISCLIFSGSLHAGSGYQTLVPDQYQGLNELDERTVIKQQVWQNLVNSDFAALEESAVSFRDKKEKTSSGLWRLTIFYDAFASLYQAGGYPSFLNIPDNSRTNVFSITEKKFEEWNKAYPQSVILPIAHSVELIAYGLTYRGHGYAGEVSGSNMKTFSNYLKLANDNLDKYKDRSSADPGWYTTKFDVAAWADMPREQFDALWKEASQKHPDFFQMYFNASRHLLPRWGGSVDEFEKFAVKAESLTSKTESRSIYARIYWAGAGTQFGNEIFKDSKASWPKMKSGFDVLMADYPDSWNWNAYLKFSCLAEDKKTTKGLLLFAEKHNLDFMPEAWNPSWMFEKCKLWAEK